MELQHLETENPEIGIDLIESKRNKGIAARVIKLLAKRAYQDKPVEYYLIRISSRNPHSKHVFEKMGVIPIRTTESTFKTFIKSFKEAMGDMGRVAVPAKMARKLYELNANSCCVCKRTGVGLNLHHIDGDNSNTTEENLAYLKCEPPVTENAGYEICG